MVRKAMSRKSIDVGSRTIQISNADKVLFPGEGITESDLAEYYRDVAGFMLPHTIGRPLSMQRFPNGIEEPSFYAKTAPDYFPDWIDRVDIEVLESGKIQPQVMANKPETLVYLADQGCITLHTWLSRATDLRKPDKLIFDLDPPEDFETARAAARSLRDLLDELELPAFIMTTGSRGLHVGVPLDAQADFDTVRDFARNAAELLAAREPEILTTETRKQVRRGRLFLDYLRNAYAQTSVPPYAVRARPQAPVATPLEWAELDNPGINARSFTISNVLKRLDKRGDLWADFYKQGVSLSAARRRLHRLAEATKRT
jgi:bifunctional non-homologous end joining protein LigD